MRLDPVFVGVLSIAVSLGLLVLTAVWASVPSAQRAVTPAPDRPGRKYRCYCWKEPVLVLVEAPVPPEVESPPVGRRRHAKPSHTDHAARPDRASLAGAGGGGRGVPPVHAVA
ncbi:hypothetical protein GCM10010326_21750 [Streptomyces xanthochromogenes]|uniref:Secreted protein n=1 Tax=Streptomyces xanthochromogenes TaxID=67384 RepID=A0ABQ2ZZA3_9ACTN|nr:hypothetical protein GCM10010326_21750 [Streptomyces xanthochromogenes]